MGPRRLSAYLPCDLSALQKIGYLHGVSSYATFHWCELMHVCGDMQLEVELYARRVTQ